MPYPLTLTQFIIGLLIAVVGIIITMANFHFSNIRRIETAAREWQEMKSKLDFIWTWFEHNVVGKGERSRSQKRNHQEED